ncbi:hypothetical protein ABT288_21465 [Streptomyces sp. NPDC001093]|uniref:hypothetical protein n=1 Tax=Streptomyces sp. NPDC001093 TaxID=3154376 RepID=UPI003324B711
MNIKNGNLHVMRICAAISASPAFSLTAVPAFAAGDDAAVQAAAVVQEIVGI